MKNFGNIILLVIFMSCNSTFKKVTSEDDIIVYKNLDNTLLYVPPGVFFDHNPLDDISIKHMDKSYYKAMIDTLNRHGVKQNDYSVPRPTYVFHTKSNDTIYATNNMDEWWVIRNNKKEYITDKNHKTLKFLLTYSNFFFVPSN